MRNSYDRHYQQVGEMGCICQTQLAGDCFSMNLARTEFFLDDGWALIGRLHQFLSKWPQTAGDRVVINDLIRGLQTIWATADDMGTPRIARVSLVLEQMLERYCAGSLELTIERLEDFAAGIVCLQELLLGLEATREEPEILDLSTILRIENHVHSAVWEDCKKNTGSSTEKSEEIFATVEPEYPNTLPAETNSTSFKSEAIEGTISENSIERTLLRMLEQFVMKIDDTCQRLHERMLTDKMPYATTTSRLEHLSQVTRELVVQIIQQAGADNAATVDAVIDLFGTSKSHELSLSSLPLQESASIHKDEFIPPPSQVTLELERLSHELVAMDLPSSDSPAFVSGPNIIEFQSNHGRILVVEESLFFRHLLDAALQSAGYRICMTESVDQAIVALENSNDFIAILVDSNLPAKLIQAATKHRQLNGIRVIGLVSGTQMTTKEMEFDDCVSRSHPRVLISSLDRLLKLTADTMRISA